MIKMKNYNGIFMIIALVAFAINMVSCDKFGAGSYSGSQKYKVNMSSDELIHRVKQLKADNPDLDVWTNNEEGELYNIDSIEDNYYYFYFKLPINGKNAIVLTVIDDRKNNPAIIMLDCFTYSQNLGGFIRINSDKISKDERKSVEFAFKKYVLDKI